MNREIRREALVYYRRPILVQIFLSFLDIALPTVTAMLIGGMADSLLALDRTAIFDRLPGFVLAVGLNVLLVPLLGLLENLLLTKRGFTYDSFLLGRFFEKPLAEIQKIDSGAVSQRLLEDSISYSFDLLRLYSRPVILAGYGGVLVFMVLFQGYDPYFCLILTVLSGTKLLRAFLRSGKKTRLKQEMSRFREDRRTMEQELGSARDLIRGNGLGDFFLARFRRLFDRFEGSAGRETTGFEGWEAVLDILCSHGVQLTAVLLGTALAAAGRLSAGALLGGWLTLPAISRAWEYGSELVTACRELPVDEKRLEVFYGDREPRTEGCPRELRGRGICFRYPGAEETILENVDFSLFCRENREFSGPNGSGKTTLLSIVAGLYQPDAGNLTDENGKVLSMDARRRAVSLLEQDGAVFSGTVWDNLFTENTAGAEAILSRLGFEPPLTYRLEPEGKNLSPGQRKKLLLARALLKDAPFLALDEPLNHLDARGQAVLREVLKDRTGVLLISHRTI